MAPCADVLVVEPGNVHSRTADSAAYTDMTTTTITTLRDVQDQDAGIEYWIESDRIGTLCREGRTVYYATVHYMAGLTLEGATREDVARKLYRHYNLPATVARVNRAILPLAMRIVAGRGYHYFLDPEGYQIGDSVMVCHIGQQTAAQWVDDAVRAFRYDGRASLL